MKDYQKEYRKNMTDEQKQIYKNNQKQYKENILMKKNKNIKKLKINVIEIDIIK